MEESLYLIFIIKSGYYRVNYDERNWQMIIKELNGPTFKRISTINRAQLIDDAFNLARTGRLDYSIALGVTTYLAQEMDYVPWKAALTAMSYLDNMLVKSEGYDKFRVIIFNKHYETILNFPIFSDLHVKIIDQSLRDGWLPRYYQR